MKYQIKHETIYQYSSPISLCYNQAYLLPRDTDTQKVISSRLETNPQASVRSKRLDFFGNQISYFCIDFSHKSLNVTAHSEIETTPVRHELNEQQRSLSWEAVRDFVQQSLTEAALDAQQYTFESPLIQTSPELVAYAGSIFLPGRPFFEAVNALMENIFEEFTYDPNFTTISTPLTDVIAHKRGVCQDFAHLAIGCLRALKLPARYVSGYIETLPAPGTEKLEGADATHAWFAVFVPGYGWVDFDPTNNKIPYDQHITTAWGRDFSDVSPLKGVIFGGGQNQLDVRVDVKRLEAA